MSTTASDGEATDTRLIAGRAPRATVYLPSARVLRVGDIVLELHGDPQRPLVVALGGISASHHLAANSVEPRRGWWDAFVGPGRALDTRYYSVLGIDYLTREGVTSRDQALVLAAALDALGAGSVHAIVGSSYGGMVALAFAELFATRLKRLIVISAAHETHPMATALRSIQRQVVRFAQSHGQPGEGLRLARALAMTTYRTAEEFAARFSGPPEFTAAGPRFPIEHFLHAHGERFAAATSPERFLALSESIDLHRIDPGSVRTPTLLVGVDSDSLVPLWQLRALRAQLAGPCRLTEISSRYGHDAFLKEVDVISLIVTDALKEGARR